MLLSKWGQRSFLLFFGEGIRGRPTAFWTISIRLLLLTEGSSTGEGGWGTPYYLWGRTSVRGTSGGYFWVWQDLEYLWQGSPDLWQGSGDLWQGSENLGCICWKEVPSDEEGCSSTLIGVGPLGHVALAKGVHVLEAGSSGVLPSNLLTLLLHGFGRRP